MNILSISSLFPHSASSHHGIFVQNRLSAMANTQSLALQIISPGPYSTLHKLLPKYEEIVNRPPLREDGRLSIHYPRYFSVPGILKHWELHFAKRSIIPYIQKNIDLSQIDVIDVHWGFPDLPLAIHLKSMIKKPVILTLRGMETFYKGDKRFSLVKKALQHVDGIVSLSQEMADFVVEMGYTGQITVIRNGVDPSMFHYVSMQDSRQELGLPFAQKIIVAVGSLIERKGFHYLIRAMKDLSSIPGATLYILGKSGLEGDYEISLRRIVDALNLQDRVVFVGAVKNKDLHLWYSAANVFCLSSLGEGSPNVLIEAIATGCPCIAHDVGEVRPAMRDVENGIVLPSPQEREGRDIESDWSRAISRVLLSAASADQRKRQSIHHSKFDWEWCAKRVLDFMQKVVSPHSSS